MLLRQPDETDDDGGDDDDDGYDDDDDDDDDDHDDGPWVVPRSASARHLSSDCQLALKGATRLMRTMVIMMI